MNEKDKIKKLKTFLEKKGCIVLTEVCCCEKINKRADLIFYKKEYGWVGIECKNNVSFAKGSHFSKTFEQIKTYQNLTFKGIKIKNWHYLFFHRDETLIDIDFTKNKIYTNKNDYAELYAQKRLMTFVNGFLKQYNIFFTVFNENNLIIYKNYPFLKEVLI